MLNTSEWPLPYQDLEFGLRRDKRRVVSIARVSFSQIRGIVYHFELVQSDLDKTTSLAVTQFRMEDPEQYESSCKQGRTDKLVTVRRMDDLEIDAANLLCFYFSSQGDHFRYSDAQFWELGTILEKHQFLLAYHAAFVAFRH